jgi:hypothetical protein
MAKLTTTTEAMRIMQVMKALTFYLNGATKADACEKAGISLDVFQRWEQDARNTLESYQDSFLEVQRQRLLMVARMESTALSKLQATLEHPLIDAQDLLKILEYLGKQRQSLENRLGVSVERNTADDFVEEVFNGPKMRIEKSKIMPQAQDAPSITVTPGPGGQLDIHLTARPSQIIDLQATNPEEEDL